MSQQKDLEKEVTIWQRRLQKLKEQKAAQGMSADPKIDIEIEKIKEIIKKIEKEIEKLQATADETIDTSILEWRGSQTSDEPKQVQRNSPPWLWIGILSILLTCICVGGGLWFLSNIFGGGDTPITQETSTTQSTNTPLILPPPLTPTPTDTPIPPPLTPTPTDTPIPPPLTPTPTPTATHTPSPTLTATHTPSPTPTHTPTSPPPPPAVTLWTIDTTGVCRDDTGAYPRWSDYNLPLSQCESACENNSNCQGFAVSEDRQNYCQLFGSDGEHAGTKPGTRITRGDSSQPQYNCYIRR